MDVTCSPTPRPCYQVDAAICGCIQRAITQLSYWRGYSCSRLPVPPAHRHVSVEDSYGIPSLEIEPLGVLENDTLDGENAGENGATATLLSDVGFGMTAHNETPLVEYPIKRRAQVNSTLAFCQKRKCFLLATQSGEEPQPLIHQRPSETSFAHPASENFRSR